ncbi:uncharacterized protein [Drosophila kikkawai]|uniref:Integrase catalytic domain-containing protein n=1 Tax=Drosophila kikkawai TaxID=30033 RepID=A0ABM4GFV9_DROKI
MYHDEETRVNKSPIDSIMPDPLRFTGVLRMHGRIEAIEDVEVNVKHPIILPSRHRVTYLIVGYYHRKYHHLHGEIVVNEIRQQYWIPGLRALVKDIVKNCSACCIRRAQPLPPIMGNLPKERLSPFTLPFTYTTRTQIVQSLSTDSFLLALKLFTARRGVPVKMLSDNGTNFRGASRVLVKEIERISTSEVESKYPEMSFGFIPPGSPHMGGAWERMVRSTKSILTEILAHAGLREEVLRAALADAADETSKRNSWPKGIVAEVHCGKDGQVRSAVVRTTEGFVTRPAVKLAKLDIVMDGNT